MMFKNSLKILLSLAMLAPVAACTDDFPVNDYVVGDGHAAVSVAVDFHPLVATENQVGGRAAGLQAGDLIKSIDDLTVFVYDELGILYNIYTQDDFVDYSLKNKGEAGANTDMPNDAGGKPVQAEESTARATFTIKDIPFGKYRIFAVANMGLENTEENREKFKDEKELHKLKVEWNETNIAANNQMFGYFTPVGNDYETSDGFSPAGPITINQKHISLHSWLKRCASKVTVVYDGSGLLDGIYVYIKSITIKDIPRYCMIGAENSVHTLKTDSMIADGGVIYYDTKGELSGSTKPSDDYRNWLEVNKGTPLVGSVTTDATGKVTAHSEYNKALYFYENCQGNYPGQHKYDKKQQWDEVGFTPTPGQYDYKDNIPYGTYVEVEAYYVSDNVNQVTNGPIKYRFMLGQDCDYSYDAFRNHHYKLTLGFNGYANQPDWHIEYIEPDVTFYVDPTYYISYSYNNRAIFPVRFKGEVESFEVEIVENNWAPYDSHDPDSVPDAFEAAASGVAFDDFRWWKDIYMNTGGDYYYGLQNPYNTDGNGTYVPTDPNQPKKVTPIWAGFLALIVPETPEGLQPYLLRAKKYSADMADLKNYFYGKSVDVLDEALRLPAGTKQNYRKFSTEDLTFNGWTEGQEVSKYVGTGNNACEIVKAPDGSTTVMLPTWTRPKTMLGISGFTGNNPYETYPRKAVVRLTAKFKGVDKPMTKFMPILQVRRILNPKGVWRQWNNSENFHVIMYQRESPVDNTFTPLTSSGSWRAYVNRYSEGADGFFELVGGVGKDETGAIVGSTGTPVEFDIVFKGNGEESKSFCGTIKVEYHGFTCNHTIFVRQGYYEPITIAEGSNTRWSSYSLFRFDKNVPFGTQWDPNNPNKPKDSDYILAEVTESPLALSTLFKRGNYAEGLNVEINRTPGLGPLDPPGNQPLLLANGGYKTWANINGLIYADNQTFAWARIKTQVDGQTRYYRVPNYQDFYSLITGAEYGIGVLYADGATAPANTTKVAYGFFDTNNDGVDDNFGTPGKYGGPGGMRGFIVFNSNTAHQVFFPIGATGIGRRTCQSNTSFFKYNQAKWNGVLRYGSVPQLLSFWSVKSANQYRPITYDIPGAAGTIYWINQATSGFDPVAQTYNPMLGWDMNFFDLNFNAYDTGCSEAVNGDRHGDALPMKLVVDEDGPGMSDL
ncbi:MAG: hypothetical protein NC043_03355 [Muribaculaceae bacterium]|nr:hypothetical protein [Muribaculaceae bacterium]